jgi:signal transduction histidine kinase
MAGERAFLARAGHELRSPLAALRAEVDVALSRPRSEAELIAALRSVSEEVDRLARLADDLLVLARASDGTLPLRRESVDLADLLSSAAARFTAQAQEHGVTIAVTRAAGDVAADGLRLRQILTNLIANAVRHSPRGGAVLLSADLVDGCARITVSDEGPGFNLDAVATSGLGLQIVRAIAAAHGGDVVVDRGDNGGARVTVSIPAASAVQAADGRRFLGTGR